MGLTELKKRAGQSKFIRLFKKSSFGESFRLLDKRLGYILPIDIVFYLVLAFSCSLLVLMLVWQIEKVSSTLPFLLKIKAYSQVGIQDRAQFLTEMASVEYFIRYFYARLITMALAFIVWMAIVTSLIKGFLWSRIFNKKFTMHFFNRFLKLNLIWFLAWFMLFLVSYLIIKSTGVPLLAVIILLLFFYFTIILFPLFDEKKNISVLIKETLRIGTLRFYKLLIPALEMYLFAVLIIILAGLFAIITYKPVFVVILALGGLFYLAWVRGFIFTVISKIKKQG